MEHYPNRSSAGLLMGGRLALGTSDHLPSHSKTKNRTTDSCFALGSSVWHDGCVGCVGMTTLPMYIRTTSDSANTCVHMVSANKGNHMVWRYICVWLFTGDIIYILN